MKTNGLRFKIISIIDEMRKTEKWTRFKFEKKKESILRMIAAARQIEPEIFPEIEKAVRRMEWRRSDVLRQAKSASFEN